MIVVFVVVFVAVFNKFFAVKSSEDAIFEEEMSVGLGLIGKLEVGLEHVLVGAIDVKVIGVGSSDDGDVGIELEERAVVLVGLDNNIFALVVDKKIAIEVLADTSEEGAASTGGFAQQMGNHSGSGSLSMAAGDGDALLTACEFAEHLGTFLHTDASGLKGLKLAGIGRHRGGVDQEVHIGGGEVGVIVIVDGDASSSAVRGLGVRS